MSIQSTLRKVGTVAVATGAAFGLVLGGSVAANAANDPSTNTVGNHVAVGSDTLQDVYGAFAGVSGNNLDSFTAFASENITLTGSGGAYQISRPAGSGDGVEALSATYNPATNHWDSSVHTALGLNSIPQTNKVIDIARSSSRPSSTFAVTSFSAANLAYVPLGRDAVSVAVKNVAGITNLSTAQIAALYGNGSLDVAPTGVSNGDVRTLTAGGVTRVQLRVGSAWTNINPKLPQASSGTRSFFQSAIGVPNGALGSWVTAQSLPENDATQLTATGDLVPFSAGQWIAQWNNVAPRTFTPGSTDVNLISLNGLAPYTVSGSVASPGALYGSASEVPGDSGSTVPVFARDVYSVVVKTAFGTGSAPVIPTTAGSVGKLVATDLPGSTSTLTSYGFKPLTYTGTATGWRYATWTNAGL